MPVRTVIERGPKGKKSAAFSLDWPGWERGAKSPELALETLESYRERYRSVASLAGMARDFDAAGPLEIVEDRIGPGSTDFWGISFAPSSTEQGPMTDAELDRAITLLRACWTFFDGVAARVSPEMRKGPRGGGRDRDLIIRHVSATRARNSRSGSDCGSLRREHSRRRACGSIETTMSRRCAVQRRPGRAAHAVHTSSATPPITPSTMRGRWRTRTSPPRTGPRSVSPWRLQADTQIQLRWTLPIPHPPLRLSHARPCVGDGGHRTSPPRMRPDPPSLGPRPSRLQHRRSLSVVDPAVAIPRSD